MKGPCQNRTSDVLFRGRVGVDAEGEEMRVVLRREGRGDGVHGVILHEPVAELIMHVAARGRTAHPRVVVSGHRRKDLGFHLQGQLVEQRFGEVSRLVVEVVLLELQNAGIRIAEFVLN